MNKLSSFVIQETLHLQNGGCVNLTLQLDGVWSRRNWLLFCVSLGSLAVWCGLFCPLVVAICTAIALHASESNIMDLVGVFSPALIIATVITMAFWVLSGSQLDSIETSDIQ